MMSHRLFCASAITIIILVFSTTADFISAECVHSIAASHQQVYLLDGSDPLSYKPGKEEQKQQQQQQQQRGAQELASSPLWRSMSVLVDTSLVALPATDLDVVTGTPYSCTAAGATVFAGGADAGVDCFDSTGRRIFQNFCRLTCTVNETLDAGKKTQLRGIVSSAVSFMQSRLEVPSTDNTTIAVASDAQNSCGGMSIPRFRSVLVKDMLVMVTARPTRNLGSNVDAIAVSCQVHEGSNRPVLAHVNINPAALFDTTQRDTQRTTVDGQYRAFPDLFDDIVHQLFHAFGFSNSSYPLFKHPSNRNKTYSEYDSARYPTGPISGAGISIVAPTAAPGSSSNNSNPNFFALDAQNVAAGDKIFFKGPNVARVAQNYFGCSTVDTTGVELENGGSSGTVTGVHWEKRVFFQEMLLGTPAPQQYLSLFSWALLQDTGYFNVPSLAAKSYRDTSAMNFGRDMGCSWLSSKCSAWGSQYFCRTANAAGCGFDDSFLAVCDLRQFSAPVNAPYQYFPSDGRLAGPDGLADNCPLFRLIQYGECTLASNAAQLGGERQTKQGMNFGTHSRCFVNRIVSASFSQPGGAVLSGCYQSFCGGAGNGGSGFIVVGQEAVPCVADKEVVELFPPARFNKANFTVTTPGATLQLSYNYHGMLQCGQLKSYCGQAAAKNLTVPPTITEVLPVIERVAPPWGDPTGGTVVTVLGQRMSRCTSAIVGGVALKDYVVINDTAVKGALRNVGQSYGGPSEADGTGDALVELKCFLLEVPVCSTSGGCIVARTKGVFNFSFTDPSVTLTATAGVFSDFFDSVGGKIVGIVMCVLVILLLIALARICFKDGHKVGDKLMEEEEDLDDEEEEKKKKDTAAATADAAAAAAVTAANGESGYTAVSVAGAAGVDGAAGGNADYIPDFEQDADDEIDIEADLANLTGAESQEMTVYI